jgi:NADPH:quinone reductase-like Zn-dependent oxidoreductase
MGARKPNMSILGNEFAGEVEAVGSEVKRFKPGDQVFGFSNSNLGAYAEFLCLPEDSVVAIKPSNLSFEEAAVVTYGAAIALPLLRKIYIQQGQKVLIIGASGSIGSALMQIAKYYGAEVTGVCGTPCVNYVRSLGADRVIDYSIEDYVRSGETYDFIIDILGRSSFSQCKQILSHDGTHLYVSFKLKQLLQMLWTSGTDGQKVICALASERVEDLYVIRRLIEGGMFKAIIDKCFPLEQTAEAHRYVEDGNRKGSIAISVA